MALALVVIALVLVGYGSVANESSESQTSLLGLFFIVLVELIYASLFISDELLFRKYKAHPLKLISWDGVFGTAMFFVILLIV